LIETLGHFTFPQHRSFTPKFYTNLKSNCWTLV